MRFLGSIIFATQSGLYWLDIVDHFLTRYGLVIVAISECLILGWIYKASKLKQHINTYSVWSLGGWWSVCIKVIAPLVLVIILISSLIEEFSKPYGGYPVLAIILLGRDWLIYTLFFAILVASHPWKIDPSERNLS